MYGVICGEWIKGSGVRLTPRPKPWVARITGLSERWGFERQFVKPVYDYTYARRTGTRGIWLYFFLEPGIYEVYKVLSWKRATRFFIRVEGNGEHHEIERDEVEACMKNAI